MADTAQNTSPGPMNLDDIAASMLSPKNNAKAPAPEKGAGEAADRRPAREVSDTDGDDDGRRLTSNSPTIEDDEDGADDSPSPEDRSSSDDPNSVGEDDDVLSDIFDAKQERDAEDADEPLDVSKLRDTMKVSVTVDGTEREVSLGELKRRYAGEGAIEKRLQEATEARNAITQDYEKSRQLTEAMLQQFGQALFRRTVPMPDESLLDVDVAAYTRQRNLYEQESQALASAHQTLYGMMNQIDKLNEQARQQQRKAAAAELRKIMPVFNDPVRGPKVREAIVEAAHELGYSAKEISDCADPRLFKTVALAARELKRQKGMKVSKTDEKPRSIGGKGTSNRPAATTSQRKEREAFKQARASGAVDDVAMTLIQRKPNSKRV
jgi:signal recognition particle subunit SEC65